MGQGLPDDALLRPPENVGGLRIPGGDNPFGVDSDDAVQGMFDDQSCFITILLQRLNGVFTLLNLIVDPIQYPVVFRGDLSDFGVRFHQDRLEKIPSGAVFLHFP